MKIVHLAVIFSLVAYFFAAPLALGQRSGGGRSGRTAPATPLDDQIDPDAAAPLSETGETLTDDTMTRVKPVARVTPPQLLASALAPRATGSMTGQPIALLEALSASSARGQSAAVAQSYWRLTAAVGMHHFALDAYQQIRDLAASQPGGLSASAEQENGGPLAAESVSARARLREAELNVLEAQQELAVLLSLPASAAAPLPSDMPHIGPYQTHFATVFTSRVPPPRTRLIDRTLPIRRKAIDVHAAAVMAAEDALQAAGESYNAEQTSPQALATHVKDLTERKNAFMSAVHVYNAQIAEYAASVAGESTSPQSFLAMLIKPRTTGTGAATGGAGSRSGASSADAPTTGSNNRSYEPRPTEEVRDDSDLGIGDPAPPSRPRGMPPRPRTRGNSQEPTPAEEPEVAEPTSLRSGSRSTVDGRTTRRVPASDTSAGDAATKNSGQQSTPAKSKAMTPTSKGGSAGASTANQDKSTNSTSTTKKNSSKGSSAGSPSASASSKPEISDSTDDATFSVEGSNEAGTADPTAGEPAAPPEKSNDSQTLRLQNSDEAGLYSGLLGLAPYKRVHKLSSILNWDRSLPEGSGSTVTLEECLAQTSGADRGAVISAFWHTRQHAARYQVLAQQAEQLDLLFQLAPDMAGRPDGAAAVVYLQAAKLRADAALLDSHAALVENQFELTRLAGRPLESQWLLPGTAPHAGRYDLKLEAQPESLAASRNLKHLAAVVSGLHNSLNDRAAAVVYADAARSQGNSAFQAGEMPISDLLTSVRFQTDETLAFLAVLTQYNVAIANYALSVLPGEMPTAKFVGSLVVTQKSAGMDDL